MVIMLHGRGASPESILPLVPEIDPGAVIYLAPAAAQSVWYPNTFLSPRQSNQPWLDSALKRMGNLVEQGQRAGLPPERTLLMGFSQGACLALEFAARHARRYGGVAGLSGGLIGVEADLQGYTGSLDGTPVFLGCSDSDPFIPVERARRSGEIMQQLGAAIDQRIYSGMGHTVNQDEVEAIASMLRKLITDLG
jgi:predicted esterase